MSPHSCNFIQVCIVYQTILSVSKRDCFNCCWGQHGGGHKLQEKSFVHQFDPEGIRQASLLLAESHWYVDTLSIPGRWQLNLICLLFGGWSANAAAAVLEVMEKPGIWDQTFFPQMSRLIFQMITDFSKFSQYFWICPREWVIILEAYLLGWRLAPSTAVPACLETEVSTSTT